MIAVVGLGLLGHVVSGCLAAWKHNVAMLDNDPVFMPDEPGVRVLIETGRLNGLLSGVATIEEFDFTTTEIAWITYDTPVDRIGRTNVPNLVLKHTQVLDKLPAGTVVIISSQVPVGFTAMMEARYPQLGFGVIPENLRRSHAIRDFLDGYPVVGTRNDLVRQRMSAVYNQLDEPVDWVSPSDAEMSKHVRNAFLATCVAFGNEMSVRTAAAGADYDAVLRIIRRDRRIGEHAYLSPGRADGRHLLRDVRYLLAAKHPLLMNDGLLQHVLESHAWER